MAACILAKVTLCMAGLSRSVLLCTGRSLDLAFSSSPEAGILFMWTTRKRSCFLGPRGCANQMLIGVIRSDARHRNLLRWLLYHRTSPRQLASQFPTRLTSVGADDPSEALGNAAGVSWRFDSCLANFRSLDSGASTDLNLTLVRWTGDREGSAGGVCGFPSKHSTSTETRR